MDIVDNITNTEVEGMSKVFNNLTSTTYFLLKKICDNTVELTLLEKKIDLGNSLLAKVNDQVLISKLKKEKEGFEEQKNNLLTISKSLEKITDTIKFFNSFYVFIKNFYILAIQKANFESSNKKISIKLIDYLQFEEENLYNKYIDVNYFSEVLLGLSLQSYHCYFKKYTKNFFDNIQSLSDPYVNSLLLLEAILYECSYFNNDIFNLANLKHFLSLKIPEELQYANYKLVALRCIFFYELIFEYFKLKPVKTNLEYLKKTVNLELNIINYKARTKTNLLDCLHDLQETLNKMNKKNNDFLAEKPEKDKESDVNKALIFYKSMEDEIQAINKKSKHLINNQYMNLTKMRRLLVIIVNEAHLSKFLELFYTKMGNDFLLNKITFSNNIQNNKEALNLLFHDICRDELYVPLNEKTNLFINEVTEAYPKDDVTVLDDITLEDLIEFSFYYISTLVYSEFSANLTGFNNKLLYTKMITLNIYINLKFEALEILEKRKNEEINKFFEKIFKNENEHSLHKRNILEEIKLNIKVMEDIERILYETKALETSLIPKLESSLVPMPEKKFLTGKLEDLEKKQKSCKLKYQKVDTHYFINKSKSERISKTNEVYSKKAKGIEKEYQKSIEYFLELLSCLSENLSESLKHIKENTQDINQFRQKFSSAMEQISLSIQKLSSSLSSWKNTKETIQDLENLSLPKLLEKTEELVIKNALISKKKHKKKLDKLQELLSSSYSSIELLVDHVNLIVYKYHSCSAEAKKILNMLSIYFIEKHKKFQFFSKSMTKKLKHQVNGKLSNDYIRLKEQSNWLEKLIRLIRCDTDDRVIKLYSLIVEIDDYQKTCDLLNKKIDFLKKVSNKTFNNSKQTLFADKEKNFSKDEKEIALPLVQSLSEDGKEIPVISLGEEATKKLIPISSFTAKSRNNENEQLNINRDSICNQESVTIEKKLTEENILFEPSQENPSNNLNLPEVTLLQNYEVWDLEFGKWKNEKNAKLYELFHIIESCSKLVLNSSDKAFLKYLSLYQKELSDKNDELKEKKNQIIFYFKSSNQARIVINYLFQYQKWFDEIFQRIILCRTLILQNENDPVVRESPRLPSSLADHRAEFNNLLTFYVGATDKYNKFRDNLINEESKLNNLNRKFIKQVLMLGSLDGIDNEENILSDFSKQLDRVNQLKLAIEQEYETKQKIKDKLFLLANAEIVKFYLSRIDPCDANNLKNPENFYLPCIQPTAATNCVVSTSSQECSICTAPAAFYCLPPFSVYPVDVVVQPSQIFYSM
jgi:hypothetical protein